MLFQYPKEKSLCTKVKLSIEGLNVFLKDICNLLVTPYRDKFTTDNYKTNIFRAVKFKEDLYLQKGSIKVTGSLLTGAQREKITTTPTEYITINRTTSYVDQYIDE